MVGDRRGAGRAPVGEGRDAMAAYDAIAYWYEQSSSEGARTRTRSAPAAPCTICSGRARARAWRSAAARACTRGAVRDLGRIMDKLLGRLADIPTPGWAHAAPDRR